MTVTRRRKTRPDGGLNGSRLSKLSDAIKAGAGYLVVSAGGNDGFSRADILQKPASSVAGVIQQLAGIRAEFEDIGVGVVLFALEVDCRTDALAQLNPRPPFQTIAQILWEQQRRCFFAGIVVWEPSPKALILQSMFEIGNDPQYDWEAARRRIAGVIEDYRGNDGQNG